MILSSMAIQFLFFMVALFLRISMKHLSNESAKLEIVVEEGLLLTSYSLMGIVS